MIPILLMFVPKDKATLVHVNSLGHERRNSIVIALELLLSCLNPSI